MATATDARTGDDLVFIGQPHDQRSTCPECGEGLGRVGLNRLVYSFEVCDVPHVEYRHLFEQLCHRSCYRKSERPDW